MSRQHVILTIATAEERPKSFVPCIVCGLAFCDYLLVFDKRANVHASAHQFDLGVHRTCANATPIL